MFAIGEVMEEFMKGMFGFVRVALQYMKIRP